MLKEGTENEICIKNKLNCLQYVIEYNCNADEMSMLLDITAKHLPSNHLDEKSYLFMM